MPPESSAPPAGPDPAAVDRAFAALRSYRDGSGRGALEPIDAAVRAALPNARGRDLEERLIGVLRSEASIRAKEYVCSQLRLLGGPASVVALVPLLGNPQLSDAARTVLQTLDGEEATRALRKALARLQGAPRIGVIDALGKRRDAGSVSALARCLGAPDVPTVAAAAQALGGIGNPRAGRHLLRFLPRCPEAGRIALADACLECAGRLAAEGQRAEAAELYRGLDAVGFPGSIRVLAAARLAGLGQPK